MPARGGLGRFAGSGGPVRQVFLGIIGGFPAIALSANGTVSNRQAMIDSSFATPATLSVQGDSSSSNLAEIIIGPFSRIGLAPAAPAFTFNVMFDVPTNTLNGGGSMPLAVVTLSYNAPGGGSPVVSLVSIPAGVVAPKATVSAAIPAACNSFTISASVQTRAIDTSGDLSLEIFETWITF